VRRGAPDSSSTQGRSGGRRLIGGKKGVSTTDWPKVILKKTKANIAVQRSMQRGLDEICVSSQHRKSRLAAESEGISMRLRLSDGARVRRGSLVFLLPF